MPKKCTIDVLGSAVNKAMAGYMKGVGPAVKRAVDRTSEEMNAEIKAHTNFRRRTGAYEKAFAIKTVFEDELNKRVRWYVKAPHYRLTHLLEFGHQIVDRNHRRHGTTRPIPHISYGEALARKRLPELCEEEMKK